MRLASPSQPGDVDLAEYFQDVEDEEGNDANYDDEEAEENTQPQIVVEPLDCPLSEEGMREFAYRCRPLSLQEPFWTLRHRYLEALAILNEIYFRLP